MNGLTWSCMICKRLRPDELISVAVRDMSFKYKLPVGSIEQNVRYCNDRNECRDAAERIEIV